MTKKSKIKKKTKEIKVTPKLIRITNFGNTRKLPYKGQYYEIPKNGHIDTYDIELALEMVKFQFVDASVIKPPRASVCKKKKKKTGKQKKSKKASKKS